MTETTLKGMRQLSDDEINLMNEIADLGNDFGHLVDRIMAEADSDQRWLAIGKTHLQTGIMCLKRAIGRPDNF